jgi:hypothetical protein
MKRYFKNKRYKIGQYGSGTLSCLKTRSDVYILFNSVRIAKTGLPDTSLAGKWVWLEGHTLRRPCCFGSAWR